MIASVFSLSGAHFWIFTLATIVVLTPVVSGPWRWRLFALANVCFLTIALRYQVVPLLLVLVIAYGLMRLIGRAKWPWAFVAGTMVLALGLFVFRKLPGVADQFGAAAVSPILAAVGYSYVFLRLYELLKCVAERRHPCPSPIQFINFLLPFHMLAAGPILPYDEFVKQPFEATRIGFRGTLEGIQRVSLGVFKKFVLAYFLQQVVSASWTSTGWYWLLEVQAHYLWIFLDFSAYTDIAVGLGRLLGVATPENFDRPYLARNLTVFWERWHMSLSFYVRRNIFTPVHLFLVRRDNGKRLLMHASIAIFLTFLFVGVWHSLSWRWFVWGGLQGVGLVAVNIYREAIKRLLGSEGVKRYNASVPVRVLATVVTFEYVAFATMIIGTQWMSQW